MLVNILRVKALPNSEHNTITLRVAPIRINIKCNRSAIYKGDLYHSWFISIVAEDIVYESKKGEGNKRYR